MKRVLLSIWLTGKERLKLIGWVVGGHSAGGWQRLAFEPKVGQLQGPYTSLLVMLPPLEWSVAVAPALGAPTKCQGCYTDHHQSSQQSCKRDTFSLYSSSKRAIKLPQIRRQLGSNVRNGLKYAWLKSWGHLPYACVSWLTKANRGPGQKDGQRDGRRDSLWKFTPGTGKGLRAGATFTHACAHTCTHTRTHSHVTCTAAGTTQKLWATPSGCQGNQTRTQTWSLAVYRWMTLSPCLKLSCEQLTQNIF